MDAVEDALEIDCESEAGSPVELYSVKTPELRGNQIFSSLEEAWDYVSMIVAVTGGNPPPVEVIDLVEQRPKVEISENRQSVLVKTVKPKRDRGASRLKAKKLKRARQDAVWREAMERSRERYFRSMTEEFKSRVNPDQPNILDMFDFMDMSLREKRKEASRAVRYLTKLIKAEEEDDRKRDGKDQVVAHAAEPPQKRNRWGIIEDHSDE